MKDKITNPPTQKAGDKEKTDLPGYPMYPASEDIYNKSQQVDDLNPVDVFETENPTDYEKPETRNEKEFKDDVSGGDLDIPGTELDDQLENIGSEDEENNFYSLGGENHNDLEEDRSI